MNEIFLIGKIIENVKYKFMVEKHKDAKAIINLELLDKTKIEIIAYNEQADYALRNLKVNNTIFVYAKLLNNKIQAIELKM